MLRRKPEEVAMQFKMIIVLVEDEQTEAVLEASRDAGATGSTVINHARGEGLKKTTTFLGLTLDTQRDVVLLLVEEPLSRHLLAEIGKAGNFDESPGTGIAFQVDVEDASGVKHQLEELTHRVEDEL
jgi:nitrogen regulatory protein PII